MSSACELATVRSTASGAVLCTPLAGMSLLDGHDLHMEVEEGGRVVIEAR